MASITEQEFQLLIDAGAVRSVEVKRRGPIEAQWDNYGTGWIVWAICGTPKAPVLKLIRSKRDPIRVFKDLGRCAAWLQELGIGHFEVEQS